MSHYNEMIVFHGTSNHLDPWHYRFFGMLKKKVIKFRFCAYRSGAYAVSLPYIFA